MCEPQAGDIAAEKYIAAVSSKHREEEQHIWETGGMLSKITLFIYTERNNSLKGGVTDGLLCGCIVQSLCIEGYCDSEAERKAPGTLN